MLEFYRLSKLELYVCYTDAIFNPVVCFEVISVFDGKIFSELLMDLSKGMYMKYVKRKFN